jgi:flagellar hook-associated protein 3 FlgL
VLTNLDPAAEMFLSDLSRIQKRLTTAGRQVSSGKKLQVASDAPDQIDSLLQLRADMERNTQISTNLGRVKTEVDTAESVLQSCTKLLDRALALANQGANSTQTASGRADIASEVQAAPE